MTRAWVPFLSHLHDHSRFIGPCPALFSQGPTEQDRHLAVGVLKLSSQTETQVKVFPSRPAIHVLLCAHAALPSADVGGSPAGLIFPACFPVSSRQPLEGKGHPYLWDQPLLVLGPNCIRGCKLPRPQTRTPRNVALADRTSHQGDTEQHHSSDSVTGLR